MIITNPHEQHRQRLRQMFVHCNPEKLPDHMLLEFLLSYSIPRIDTNPIAHELIDRFGSLENVLDADIEDLQRVDGVGENSALLLKMVPLFCNRYAANKLKPRMNFQSIERAADFFREYYISKNKEIASALLLDNANRLICHVELHEEAVNSSNINTRGLAQIALSYNAAGLILAHNHPSGDPTPSDADLHTTKQLLKAFSAIDLNLRAHLVIAGDRYVDVVQTLYDRAHYEVKYVAFRAENRPPLFDDVDDDLPVRHEYKALEGDESAAVPYHADPTLQLPAADPVNASGYLKDPLCTENDELCPVPQIQNKESAPEKTLANKTEKPPLETGGKCRSVKQKMQSTRKKSKSKAEKPLFATTAYDAEQLTVPEAIRLLEQQTK